MIVTMAAGLAANLTFNPLDTVTTVTVQIVTLLTGDQEFNSAKTLSAFGLGLTLFLVTLMLNIVAQRIVSVLGEPCVVDGHVLAVRASVGIVEPGYEPGLTPEIILHRADGAMYAGKRRGKSIIVAYDPTGFYGRIQRMLWNLSEGQLAAHRSELLFQAGEALRDTVKSYTGPGHGAQEQLLALTEARDIALKVLYPALLTHLHAWPEFEIRLPHAWRASAGLKFPKAVYHLENLYGFGGETEARRVLLATRGLGLVEEERRARAAFQAGYYDGAVRYLRDEAARTHRHDLERWAFISSARRDRLSTLLGVTRSPLGPAALDIVTALIEDVREGQ